MYLVQNWETKDGAERHLSLTALPEPFRSAAEVPSRFGARERPNWFSLGLIVAAHAAALIAFIKLDVIELPKDKPEPLVVELINLTQPPAAEREETPKQRAREEVQSPVVTAPPPILPIPNPPASPVTVRPVEQPAPPAPAAPPQGAPAGPVSVGDIASQAISMRPPRYPIESRRRREQGTVELHVTVAPDGTVRAIEIGQSSGFSRLDEAALDAVRHWRWTPVIRNGIAVAVSGIVSIPFVLQG
jgi:protein TonB